MKMIKPGRQPSRSPGLTHGLLLLLLLGGCASSVPGPIRTRPALDLNVAQVRASPDHYRGLQVRWGGSILSIRNQSKLTEIEIFERSLDSDGEPRTNQAGKGRFIALIDGFLDPEDYAKDRKITVAGTVLRTENRRVGEYDYAYPIVKADSHYLWPESYSPAYPYNFGPGLGPWGMWYGPYYGGWWGPWYYW